MANFIYLLTLLSSTLASTVTSNTFNDESLIRQVMNDNDHQSDEELLNADHHFTLFKSKYGKAYVNQEEHDYRFSVFKANLRRAKRHQLLDPSAVHGVTKFSDITEDEFSRSYLGLKLGLPADAKKLAEILPTDNLPADIDWREHGAVTSVKDQGFCDASYIFSSSGALEGAMFKANGKLVDLSVQQLLDCDHLCDQGICDSGCNGGLMTNAFQYTLRAGGLQTWQDYPYTMRPGNCVFDTNKIAATIANYSYVYPDEDQMAANLVKYGPLSAGISGEYMQTYIGGVLCPIICLPGHVDTAVLIVGYAPIRLKKKPYWIIKNSWGNDWGEKGYINVCRGQRICGIETEVSRVTAAIRT